MIDQCHACGVFSFCFKPHMVFFFFQGTSGLELCHYCTDLGVESVNKSADSFTMFHRGKKLGGCRACSPAPALSAVCPDSTESTSSVGLEANRGTSKPNRAHQRQRIIHVRIENEPCIEAEPCIGSDMSWQVHVMQFFKAIKSYIIFYLDRMQTFCT